MTETHISLSRGVRAGPGGAGVGQRRWDSLRSAEEYCSSATARRAPRPPGSYGVSAALPQRPAEPGDGPGRKPGGAHRWRAASSGRAAPGELRVSEPPPGRAGPPRSGPERIRVTPSVLTAPFINGSGKGYLAFRPAIDSPLGSATCETPATGKCRPPSTS